MSGDDIGSSLGEIFLSLRILPFLVTTIGYFIVLSKKIDPSFFAVVTKCAPVVSLMAFVMLSSENYQYTKRILMGQIFCCIGDAFLVFPEYFELGVLAFVFGHLHYILAFGWSRAEFKKGVWVLGSGILVLAYLLPSNDIKGVMTYGVPIYVVVIDVMVWRAIARVFHQDCQNQWRWVRKVCAFGAVLFAISDFLIATTMFRGLPGWSPGNLQFLVMSTYYLAQFGIALSVCEVPKPVVDVQN